MKFIKYKQVARITLYGFDDLYRGNNSSVYTEPLNSIYFTQNLIAGVQVGNNAKRMRFQIKGLDNVNNNKLDYRGGFFGPKIKENGRKMRIFYIMKMRVLLPFSFRFGQKNPP